MKGDIGLQIIKCSFWCQGDQSPEAETRILPAASKGKGSGEWSKAMARTGPASPLKHPAPRGTTGNGGQVGGGLQGPHTMEQEQRLRGNDRNPTKAMRHHTSSRHTGKSTIPRSTLRAAAENWGCGGVFSLPVTDVRGCGNAWKTDSLRRHLAEVRDRNITVIGYFSHRCIAPEFPELFLPKLNIITKGRHCLLQ